MAKGKYLINAKRWPGVYGYDSTARKDTCYYFAYRAGKKIIWEKAGWKIKDGYSPEIAAELRAERMKSKRHGDKVKTNKEIKREQQTRNRTIEEIKTLYFESERGKALKGRITDLNRYDKHLKPLFARKRISDLSPLDVERLKKAMADNSTATKSNALELLRRIINYGAKHNYCPRLSFTIELPTKNNLVTEYLTPSQVAKLNDVLNEWPAKDVARMLRLAMFTGLRRGEIFKLQDNDIDYRQNLIELLNPKGGINATIPMSAAVKKLLKEQQAWKVEIYPESPFIFPGKYGRQRTDSSAVKRIKEKAGLPAKFRIFHGLRHHFAVSLANSGEATLDMIGELLTHKSPQITRRYAKYLPDTKRSISNRAADLIQGQIEAGEGKGKKRGAA